MSYANPGWTNNVYVGKVNGEWQYLLRQYLLWLLRDLLEVVNGKNN